MRDSSVPIAHFEALYAARPDPWRLSSSDYEQKKYARTLAALPRRRYPRALELGCAIGVFTTLLAPLCGDLLAVDPVEAALAQARERNRAHPHVRFAQMFVPDDWPSERFDLVIASEILDYLGETDLTRLASRLRLSLAPGGDLLFVHWVGKKKGGPTGREASDRLVASLRPQFAVSHQERNPRYRLDLLRRA